MLSLIDRARNYLTTKYIEAIEIEIIFRKDPFLA